MKKPRRGTPEAFRQFITGNDFEPPEWIIADLTPEQATAVPPGFSYSVAGLVGHMLFWQRRWLGRIDGQPLERKRRRLGDWPLVGAEEWEAVRDVFLEGLRTAGAKAGDEAELGRVLWNGDTVDEVLLMLVLHNTYHLGQISLVRQLLRLWPPEGGTAGEQSADEGRQTKEGTR